MKFVKKILVILFCVGILAQIPFVYQLFQKRNLSNKIAELDSNRTANDDPKFNEYKGVIHVHSWLGGHSTGDFEELLKGAQVNELDFVVMTEHASAFYDTSTMTLRGFNEGVLFVGGNELDTENQDRYLLLPGSEKAEEMTRESNEEFLEIIHSQDKIAIMSYPEKYKEWDSKFDGIEVFNMSTNLKAINVPYFLFDALWSFPAFPELTLANYLSRPDENLRKFDEISIKRNIMLIGGPDAHSNIGFHILGDDAQHKFLDLKFDSFERSFRISRTHVLIEKNEELSQESLLKAIKDGHSYLGFDVLSDSRGFKFSASNGRDSKIMGDEIEFFENQTELKAISPQVARFVLFKNGAIISESEQQREFSMKVSEKGVYRVEVYLDSLGKQFNSMPWIISNPIYVN